MQTEIVRAEADIEQVLADVLALTKPNYNACMFGDGIPVTLSFGRLWWRDSHSGAAQR